MSKTVLVKVGDFVKKEDSGLVTKVESITVNKRNRLRSIVRLVGAGFEVEISGATRKDFKASLQGYELVEVNPSAASAELEEPSLPPAHVEEAPAPAKDEEVFFEEEACSWKPGDLVEHDVTGDRFRVVAVGLRPGETPEPRCLIELQNTATSTRSKTDAPVIDGVMAIDGFTLIRSATEVAEFVAQDTKVLEALPEAPLPGQRTLPGVSTHLEHVTRAWARTVASTVRRGTLTKGEMLDVLFALTAGVGLECDFTPGVLGDNMALVAGELVKVKAEGRAS